LQSNDRMMSFKVYERPKNGEDKSYNFHLAIGSDDNNFDIYKVTVNGKEQECFDKYTKDLIWPKAVSILDTSTANQNEISGSHQENDESTIRTLINAEDTNEATKTNLANVLAFLTMWYSIGDLII